MIFYIWIIEIGRENKELGQKLKIHNLITDLSFLSKILFIVLKTWLKQSFAKSINKKQHRRIRKVLNDCFDF